MRALWVTVLLAGACARPLPVARTGWVVDEVARRAPPPVGSARLLRPRFGLPAIVRAGDPFDLALLADRSSSDGITAALIAPAATDEEAAACARGRVASAGCVPLALAPRDSRALEAHAFTVDAQARAITPSPPAPGGWDLVVAGASGPADSAFGAPYLRRGPIERAHRAVWLRADDPAALSELHVAHLSDLHLGKRDDITPHLKEVLDEVNRRAPDLVIVTGDVANNGDRPALFDEAARALEAVQAPVVVIPGNHDHGFGPGAISGRTLSNAWAAFARAFHPFEYFALHLGRWRFVGFDSGASIVSPFVQTRGVSDETVAAIHAELEAARATGEAGVVLFSHAPSRARLTGKGPSRLGGPFGHMFFGAAALERELLDAARHDLRVLHLSGHTHWNDVFESDREGRSFVRWDHHWLDGEPHAITGRAALLNVQSATHSTFDSFDNGRGWGFYWLVLRSDGAATVELRRFGVDQSALK